VNDLFIPRSATFIRRYVGMTVGETMESSKQWDGAVVRTWLECRIAAARADQVAAERGGRGEQDDCDKAAAEEMVCTALSRGSATDSQRAFADMLDALLDRDDYVWRGVYDDRRFDRHARTYIRKLRKMTRDYTGFEQRRRYQ
jgi:hypothetical protein